MTIFWGLIGILAAAAMIYYRRQIIEFTGTWGWAEKYLGAGQSQSACIFLAIIIFFISLSIMTGAFDGAAESTAEKFFGNGKVEK